MNDSDESFITLSALDDASAYLIGIFRGTIELDRKKAIKHALDVANQLFGFWDTEIEVVTIASDAQDETRALAAQYLEALSVPHATGFVNPALVAALVPILLDFIRGWLKGKR